MKKCHACGREWEEKHSPGFREECLGCLLPLHVCLNCRFYLADSREWCSEPAARDDRPRAADLANQCGFFVFSERSGSAAKAERQAAAKKRLEDLFG